MSTGPNSKNPMPMTSGEPIPKTVPDPASALLRSSAPLSLCSHPVTSLWSRATLMGIPWSVPPLRTGLSSADAQDDFLRARRQQARSRLLRWMSRADPDIDVILPFDEVVRALGRVTERDLGVHVIPLDSIIGTVDRPKGFDRDFRPTSSAVRTRWERIAAAIHRGDPMPAISVYRVGEVHFVRDGHHRVSVARALGRREIDAHVVEVVTHVGADRTLRLADLPHKSHERLFHERVPLPSAARGRVRLNDPWQYATLAEGIEAWAFRAMQERGELLDRETAARLWYEEEFRPVVHMLEDADLLGEGTDADAYMRVAADRYRLMHTHEWSEDILARLREKAATTTRR
jgi:hypothetical protein